MKISKHIHPVVDLKIQQLNDVLTKHIMKKTEGKKTLLDLSGGHDTRTNLSILLKNKIEFTAFSRTQSVGDIPIAKQITKEFNIPHIIKGKESVFDTFNQYDIRILGVGYTETLSALHELNRNFNTIVSLVEGFKDTTDNFRYSPIVEQEAIDIVKEIPIIYLAGGIIQRRIMEINEPKLLQFPFTYYDLRHRLMNKYYIHVAKIIFNSYYRGKGRNYRDDKKTKDIYSIK